MNQYFWQGKEVLITGGTGSLGKVLTKQLLQLPLKGLRIFSRDELKQWQMRRKLTSGGTANSNIPIAFLLGDIRDLERLNQALQGVDVVIHAAALKQVDTAEENPHEYIKTNCLGTINVMNACIACGVQKAMFVSTDKAVYPINLYGASKLVAEKVWLKGSVYSGGEPPYFSVCRYGNVIGSRGSVIQVFHQQMDARADLTITNKKMTRFWITIPKVAKFILDRMTDMKGEEIFVPKMISCTIALLAKAVAGEDWPLKEVGIRPGEKLHECLITKEERCHTKAQEDYYIIGQRDFPPRSSSVHPLTSDNNELEIYDTPEGMEQIQEMIK
jgi:UDP-N-acetylglucosamine 4,6-dehydratase